MNHTETIFNETAANPDVVSIAMNSISNDPIYMEYFAMKFHFFLRMIHKGEHHNMLIPNYMYTRIATALKKYKKSFKGSKILFLGVAYKPDIDDERESPTLNIMDIVAYKGGLVSYHDPYIPAVKTHSIASLSSIPLTGKALADADCVVLTTNHKAFDVPFIRAHAKMIVDMRNMVKEDGEKVYKL